MSELLQTYHLLADALLADPFLALASTVVWLDPMWMLDDSDLDEDGDSLGMALSITRRAFPDIYAGAIQRLHIGADARELEIYLCSEISQRGIPLDSLEFIGYGIPLTACGVELSDPDFYAARPDLLPLLDLFGIHPEMGSYTVEVPEWAYTAGRILADSLTKQDDPGWQQVGWTLTWLFSCSGNSLIDYDDEALAEIPPLTWEKIDLAFAVELIEETDAILQDVNAGLELIEANASVLPALSRNVNRVRKTIAKQKGKKHEPHLRLEWPPVGSGADRATVADHELLQLRGDAA